MPYVGLLYSFLNSPLFLSLRLKPSSCHAEPAKAPEICAYDIERLLVQTFSLVLSAWMVKYICHGVFSCSHICQLKDLDVLTRVQPIIRANVQNFLTICVMPII